jgi:hypothetical protein
MSVLRQLWKWWRELWDCDFEWATGVDSHRWENKIEMLHRLSGRPD